MPTEREARRRALEHALHREAGAAEPALVLLDHLDDCGDDDAALDVEPRLSTEARADPRVRARLARAAARAGDTDGARARLGDIRDAAAVEAWRRIALRSMADADFSAAGRALDRAREASSSRTQIGTLDALEDQLTRETRDAGQRVALALQGLLEVGALGETDRRARAMLADDPDNVTVQRILSQLDVLQRSAASDARLTRGDVAFEGGRFLEAIVHYREARRLGAAAADVDPRIVRAEQADESGPTVTLETPRLRAMVLPPEAAEQVAAFYRRNAAHLAPWDPPRSRRFTTPAYWRERLALNQDELDRGVSARFCLLPREGADGLVIGVCNLTNLQRGPRLAANIGYALDGEFEGRGLMTEAVRAVLDYGFESLGLHRIEAGYQPHNVRSGALLRRLGFAIDGYARDYLFVGGAWSDHVLTSIVNPSPVVPTTG